MNAFFVSVQQDWRLIRNIFFQPYFMLYGEVFAPDIDPECSPDCEDYGECGTALDGSLLVPCTTGRWITPIIMTIYLLVANILLINLLIASFNTIYNRVSAVSQQIFNFQRFAIVMEYEEKPILPVPFIAISHAHLFGKYVLRRVKGINTRFESGLKLVLGKFDMERLYDFEEEGVEGLMRSKEEMEQQNLSSKLKNLMDVSEELKSKLYDLEKWETMSQEATQSLEYRLQRLEEMAEQTANHLTVIHRFMAATNAVELSTRVNSDEDEEDGLAVPLQIPPPPSPNPSTGAAAVAPPTLTIRQHSTIRAASMELELRGIERKTSVRRSTPLAEVGLLEEGDSDSVRSTPLSKQDTFESEATTQQETPADEKTTLPAVVVGEMSTPEEELPEKPRRSSCSSPPPSKGRSNSKKVRKLRHASSGGSSGAAAPSDPLSKPSELRRRRIRNSNPRIRHMTESSEDDHQMRLAMLQHQRSVVGDDYDDGGGGTPGTADEENSNEAYIAARRQMKFAR
jgi:hypothetical protein